MKKVFADVMLAKLARWLRFAGIRVYDAPVEDDDLLLKAVAKSNGILLTCDEALFARARRSKTEIFLIRQDALERQMAQAANSLGVKIKAEQSRVCPVCSSTLVRMSKDKVEATVPPEARKRYLVFLYCRSCKKAYWHGTHWKDILATLKSASRLQRSMRKEQD